MENNFVNSFTLYFILLISLVLVVVDFIELYKIIVAWNSVTDFNSNLFLQCVKYPLITKTGFAIFSIMTAVCITLMSIFLVVDVNYFLDKLITSYLNLLFYIFGPTLLAFCIIAFYHWDKVAYMCDEYNTSRKVFSITNMFTIVGSFIIACIVSFGYAIYESVLIHVLSILRKEGGSAMVRNAFWWFVFRSRRNEDDEIIRNRRNNNSNINNSNLNNNNINNQSGDISMVIQNNNNENNNSNSNIVDLDLEESNNNNNNNSDRNNLLSNS